jgi:hypothetical protein
MIGKAVKGVKKALKKKKKKSKKKSTKKKSVLGGAQTLAGKALLNPITATGAIGYGVGRGSGRASEKQKTNRLNEALRRRGVRV